MSARHYIYRNLNKFCFSHQYKGKVVGYPTALKLDDAKFRVSSLGRNRVIKEKRKNNESEHIIGIDNKVYVPKLKLCI